ncbi:hypothetical protein ScalyP_jg7422 [Parmales sp. scaly parma]|nr:hypothetical protein ScalyP_jg7422 [Parmales sp. scaly parma]
MSTYDISDSQSSDSEASEPLPPQTFHLENNQDNSSAFAFKQNKFKSKKQPVDSESDSDSVNSTPQKSSSKKRNYDSETDSSDTSWQGSPAAKWQGEAGKRRKQNALAKAAAYADADANSVANTNVNSNAKKNISIDSDSDSDLSPMQNNTILLKARAAREKLAMAQKLVLVDTDSEDEIDNSNDKPAAAADQSPAQQPAAAADQSPAQQQKTTLPKEEITISLRESEKSKIIMKVVPNYPLSCLIEAYVEKKNDASIAIENVQLWFDGDLLKVTDSCETHDAEDDDCFEVKIVAGARPKSASISKSKSKNAKVEAGAVIIQVKRNNLKTIKKFKVKKNNPFSKVVAAFEKTHNLKAAQKKKLKFYLNGAEINVKSSPEVLGITGESVVFGMDNGNIGI